MKLINGGTFSNTAGDAVPLTLEHLRTVVDTLLKDAPPPPPKLDLFGSRFVDKPTLLPELPKSIAAYVGASGRRMLIVPEQDKMHWYDQLCQAGADVRLEPRITEPASRTASPE